MYVFFRAKVLRYLSPTQRFLPPLNYEKTTLLKDEKSSRQVKAGDGGRKTRLSFWVGKNRRIGTEEQGIDMGVSWEYTWVYTTHGLALLKDKIQRRK